MATKIKSIILIAFCFVGCATLIAQTKKQLEKDMRSQNLIWEQLFMQWNEGAFLGNALIGMVVYIDKAENEAQRVLDKAIKAISLESNAW